MFALKKNNKNFLLGLCALIVAVAMVSVGVTLAANNNKPNFETNVVVIGNIDIDLIDEYYEVQSDYDSDPDGEKHYDEDNPPSVLPETTVDKVISVKNVGTNPCYVRLLIRRVWNVNGSDLKDKITLNIHTADWTKGADINVGGVAYECYYYNKILAAGERAHNLCDTFRLGTFDLDAVQDSTGQILVFAQAVQSDFVDSSTIIKEGDRITGWSNDLVFN